MSPQSIPIDIQNFIIKHIDSIAEFEAFMLLRGDPQARWTPSALAGRLYTSDSEAEAAVSRLSIVGFAKAEAGLYRFECASPELEEMADRLAETYRRHLIAVTNIVHGKRRGMRQFADAFKLRKDS